MFQFLQTFASTCTEKYGFPTWYKYLGGHEETSVAHGKEVVQCVLPQDFTIQGAKSLTGIGLAVIEILLRVGGIVAIGFVIYGGFQYLTSQGEPDRTRSAKDTILNAIIGLVIAILATTIVRFIAGRLT